MIFHWINNIQTKKLKENDPMMLDAIVCIKLDAVFFSLCSSRRYFTRIVEHTHNCVYVFYFSFQTCQIHYECWHTRRMEISTHCKMPSCITSSIGNEMKGTPIKMKIIILAKDIHIQKLVMTMTTATIITAVTTDDGRRTANSIKYT